MVFHIFKVDHDHYNRAEISLLNVVTAPDIKAAKCICIAELYT